MLRLQSHLVVVPELTVNGIIFLLPAACYLLSQKEGTVCISFGFLMALPAHINHKCYWFSVHFDRELVIK